MTHARNRGRGRAPATSPTPAKRPIQANSPTAAESPEAAFPAAEVEAAKRAAIGIPAALVPSGKDVLRPGPVPAPRPDPAEVKDLRAFADDIGLPALCLRECRSRKRCCGPVTVPACLPDKALPFCNAAFWDGIYGPVLRWERLKKRLRDRAKA